MEEESQSLRVTESKIDDDESNDSLEESREESLRIKSNGETVTVCKACGQHIAAANQQKTSMLELSRERSAISSSQKSAVLLDHQLKS